MINAEPISVSCNLNNIVDRSLNYLEKFKVLFQNLILYFHNNKVEIPVYVQAHNNYLGHIVVVELQKMFDKNTYSQEMEKFVDTFKKATEDGQTKFFYSYELGTQPNLVTTKLF